MGRNILAVIAGIVAAALTVFLFETVAHALLPAPAGMDATNPESVKAAMANLPLSSYIAVIVAWCAGSFVGAWIAVALARSHHTLCAMLVAAGIALSGIATMVMIPHPIWLWIAGTILPFPSALAAARLRRRLATV